MAPNVRIKKNNGGSSVCCCRTYFENNFIWFTERWELCSFKEIIEQMFRILLFSFESRWKMAERAELKLQFRVVLDNNRSFMFSRILW